MAITTLSRKADTLPELGNPTTADLTDDQLRSLARSYGNQGTEQERLEWASRDHLVTTWAGCVLKLREANHYDDSDFYAIVWDATANRPREICYATTRGWTYWNSAKIDATEEAQAAYKAWLDAVMAEQRAEREAKEAATPRAGKLVEVIAGRKLPKGTKAEVFWYGEDKYNSSRWATFYRVGLLVDGKKIFLDANHVKVVVVAVENTPVPVVGADGRARDPKTGRYVKAA